MICLRSNIFVVLVKLNLLTKAYLMSMQEYSEIIRTLTTNILLTPQHTTDIKGSCGYNYFYEYLYHDS